MGTPSTVDAMAVLAALVDVARHPEAVKALAVVRARVADLDADARGEESSHVERLRTADLNAALGRVAELEAENERLRADVDAVRAIRAGGAEPIFDDDLDAAPTGTAAAEGGDR